MLLLRLCVATASVASFAIGAQYHNPQLEHSLRRAIDIIQEGTENSLCAAPPSVDGHSPADAANYFLEDDPDWTEAKSLLCGDNLGLSNTSPEIFEPPIARSTLNYRESETPYSLPPTFLLICNTDKESSDPSRAVLWRDDRPRRGADGVSDFQALFGWRDALI